MKKLACILLSLFVFTTSFAQKGKKQTKPEVFSFVEQMPEAEYDMIAYLSNNIEYPAEAREKGIEGKVYVKFIVDEKGNIDSVHIVRDPVGGGCDEEAVRVVKSFPPWKPGKQNGVPVKVYYMLPIVFKLDHSAETEKK